MNGTKRVSKEVELRLALEERLIKEAQRVGCHRSQAETVTSALEEYVRLRKQQNILCVYGELEDETIWRDLRDERERRKGCQ